MYNTPDRVWCDLCKPNVLIINRSGRISDFLACNLRVDHRQIAQVQGILLIGGNSSFLVDIGRLKSGICCAGEKKLISVPAEDGGRLIVSISIDTGWELFRVSLGR